MAKDYKHRANQPRKQAKKPGIAWWKWLLVVLIISAFVWFLTFLQQSSPTQDENQTAQKIDLKSTKPKPTAPQKTELETEETSSSEPHFTFYTKLPEKENFVPDYEIETRNREEQFGKAIKSDYIVQAGSFKNYEEADKLKAQLTLANLEPRIQQVKIGKTLWNRVIMGPFHNPSSIVKIKKQLKQNGIDVKVMEKKR